MDRTPGEEGRPGDYLSYLLRLWREGEGGRRWRASLHNPHTGQRLGFGSVDDLVEYLRHQMDAADAEEGAERR